MSFTNGEQNSPSEQQRSEASREIPSFAAGQTTSAPACSDGPFHTQGRPAFSSATAPVVPFLTLQMVERLLAEIRNLTAPPRLLNRADIVTHTVDANSEWDA
jgi:hypothetical protein